MMMKTAREEKAFGVNKKSGEFTALPVTFVLFQYILHNVPDLEIPFAILIPSNVPAEFRGLSQMVGICLLTQSQTIPSRYSGFFYIFVILASVCGNNDSDYAQNKIIIHHSPLRDDLGGLSRIHFLRERP